MAELSQAEQYIIDESPEINIGENPGWLNKFFKIFPALRVRNFQLYFLGQLISLIGTWLQIVAQGWLVLQLTNSALLIGVVTAASSLPLLLFSLQGGLIVDRFQNKKLLVILTQTGQMILAFVLGFLTLTKVVNVWEITILAFLLGVISAVDFPARQVFTVEMVGKDILSSAIALNSGIFNAARVIGPGVAGILIAVFGTGGAFMLNGISFFAVIIALFFIKTIPLQFERKDIHPVEAIKEGINYAVSHPMIKTLLLITGVVSIFGWSYTTILPVIAQNTFHFGAAGLGYLYAANGAGALIATILVSGFTKKFKPLDFILVGNVVFAVSVFLFSFTNNFIMAAPFLFCVGLGLLSQFSMINTTLQNSVGDRLRGRVMSLYTFMFIGLSPLGNLESGYLADRFGTAFSIQVGAVITFAYGIYLFTKRRSINEKNAEYLRRQL